MWSKVKKWLDTGTSEEFGFIINTRIRTINLAAMVGGSASLLFTILNFSTGHYLLGAHTLVNLILLGTLIYFNARHNFLKGPATMMVLLSLAFTSNGILFHNGMEFYVLLVVCLGLLLFDNMRVILLILFINSILFLVAHKVVSRYAIQPSIANRSFINMAVWLVILLLCLYTFKKRSLMYLQRLELANKQLQESNRSKEKLFSIVAHDMRSPLNSLTATLDLLNNQFIDEKTFRELSSLLSNQTKHLNENMDVLLRWATSQLRGIEVNAHAFDLCIYIRDILQLLAPLMEFKHVRCEAGCNGPVMVFADTDHVQLILRNLITNAIKFSHTGGVITVSASCEEKGKVWVHVQDNGIGMSQDAVNNLFNPAVIQSLPGTGNEKGIGLGLQLSNEFVQKNGGSITVKSTPSKGSIFSFSLPAAPGNYSS
ncbi:sensor histidine kinase [Filimonas effusa]|uniref:histidine kinase n=1 Tax=Filimonas effusa TaxID=2508721 RepID=A0A4V1M9F2_9BACT|nr:HAMP domain-containing sensor histidine kinase [Filimonas effusa]RXK80892.1 HAMP domain-containing histidine kinase [Filimonas effusa]